MRIALNHPKLRFYIGDVRNEDSLRSALRGVDYVFILGPHLPEVLGTFQSEITNSDVLQRLGLQAGSYFLVSAHREENVDEPLRLGRLLDALNGLAEIYDLPVLVSTHPRTRARLEALSDTPLDARLRFEKPFGFFDYVHLQQRARCVLSDSGTITEESAILGFPAITIRDTHERPEGMDEGIVIMCGLDRPTVLDTVRLAVAEADADRQASRVAAYHRGNVSWKLLKLLHSYIPYVQKNVWRQPDAPGA